MLHILAYIILTAIEMKETHFLWVDDEIDLLKPYILFLEEKGYAVECANNGQDAIELCRTGHFDMIFLDEHMPGLSGLDTLAELHAFMPDTPVVMVTKSEDEGIMNKAIGRKIADYLIKPVNPNQILMTIKKILDKKEIMTEETIVNYREEFNALSLDMKDCLTHNDWINIYKRLVYWEMELSHTRDPMKEFLSLQKAEADNEFGKFIRRNYGYWMRNDDFRPVLSPELFSTFVFPILDKGEKLFFILIDNFRLDQWMVVKDIVSDHFTCIEDTYFSILPTATQYARNSIFSGLMPARLVEMFPDLWIEEAEEEGKNLFEEPLIRTQFERHGCHQAFSYHKVNNNLEGEKLVNNFSELERNDLNVMVFNFIDMLSHARTESKMIRELASDEAAYRSLTRSWFQHSPLPGLLKRIADKGYKAILTTDHGTIRVKKAVKIVGDKQTSLNLRYKLGRNLSYDMKKVFEMKDPGEFGLPSPNVSSRYVFALNDDFFAYPNNYHYYASYYENTFQHGGISMEEMIVPLVTLIPR